MNVFVDVAVVLDRARFLILTDQVLIKILTFSFFLIQFSSSVRISMRYFLRKSRDFLIISLGKRNLYTRAVGAGEGRAGVCNFQFEVFL